METPEVRKRQHHKLEFALLRDSAFLERQIKAIIASVGKGTILHYDFYIQYQDNSNRIIGMKWGHGHRQPNEVLVNMNKKIGKTLVQSVLGVEA